MRGGSVLSTEEKADLVRRLEAGERASALANEADMLRKSALSVASGVSGVWRGGSQPQKKRKM